MFKIVLFPAPPPSLLVCRQQDYLFSFEVITPNKDRAYVLQVSTYSHARCPADRNPHSRTHPHLPACASNEGRQRVVYEEMAQCYSRMCVSSVVRTMHSRFDHALSHMNVQNLVIARRCNRDFEVHLCFFSLQFHFFRDQLQACSLRWRATTRACN